MKIFIFQHVDKCSPNYHPEGGLVLIAKDIEQAKLFLKEKDHIEITDEEWEDVESFELADNVESKYWIMPNAGCC